MQLYVSHALCTYTYITLQLIATHINISLRAVRTFCMSTAWHHTGRMFIAIATQLSTPGSLAEPAHLLSAHRASFISRTAAPLQGARSTCALCGPTARSVSIGKRPGLSPAAPLTVGCFSVCTFATGPCQNTALIAEGIIGGSLRKRA